MDQSFSDQKPGKPRVLVAPLDWGLGHATRCIPLIRTLLHHSCEVWLAGEGAQKVLLQSEFPTLPFLDLKGYRVRYSKTRRGLTWKIIRQLPSLQRTIKHEHQWLRNITRQYAFDLVISDNRYGLHHPDIPCILLTHQLAIQSPFGKWSGRVLRNWHYKHIERFRACWVPDWSGQPNLGGNLSHPSAFPSIPVDYIGPLSRFISLPGITVPKKILVLLSGPEPQRTLFEEKIIAAVAHYPHAATIVRGLPGSDIILPSSDMIRFYNHLPSALLNQEMAEAELVIARSGYSTIMDLAALQKKAVLVPTPGQTEQEYLAGYLESQQFAPFMTQENFDWNEALQRASHFRYQFPTHQPANNLPGEVISKTLASLHLKPSAHP